MAVAEMWETVQRAIEAYTGMSAVTFFTVLAIAAAFYHVVSGFLQPRPPLPRKREMEMEVEPLQPPVQLGEITEEELRVYDGSDPKMPLLMAIKGQIYDVSQSRMFYGPGGPYALFAGKDASRALAKMSFEEKDLTGDISGLGPFDLEALQDWEYKFMSKYVKVGTIMKTVPVTDGAASSASENTEPAAISTKSGPKDCPAEHGAEPKEGNPAESEANPAGHGEESKDFGSPEESSKEFLSWVRMADIKPSIQRWEDMAIDGLVQIFRELNMNELAPVSQVCRSWRLACSDLLVWSTLDLGLLKSNFIQTRVSPYIWVDGKSDKRLRRVLRTAMALSCGNITCMIFHFNLYMKDEHLDDIAKRCPHIKRLVLPAWDCMTTNAICQAISRWQGLESMTMPWTSDSPYIMEEISRSCKNFSQLKIMDAFDMQFATSIAANIPKLRVLSLRCSMVTKEALMFVLDCMENLEVLNISHCILLEGHFPSKLVRRQLDDTIMQKASRLREFFHCQSNSCTSCQRMITDKGYMKWWKYEEWFWRQDEVSSLGLGDYGRLFDQRCINQVQD